MKKTMTEANAPQMTKMVLSEDTGTPTKNHIRVRGVFQAVDKMNENNRMYGDEVWDRNLAEDSPFMKSLRSRVVLGELEHPADGNTMLPRVSHLIENVWRETLTQDNPYGVTDPGDYIIGESLILNTPNGKILQALYEADVMVGVSSRGRGDTKLNPEGWEDVTDYDLDTWDFVYQPSVSEARPTPISESAKSISSSDAVKRSGSLIETAAMAVRSVDDLVELVELNASVYTLLEGVDNSAPKNVRTDLLACGRRLDEKIAGIKSGQLVVEDGMEKVAGVFSDSRKKETGDVYKDELEKTLDQYGHDANSPDSVSRLANALRQKGYNVKDKEYNKKETGTSESNTEKETTSDSVALELITSLAEKYAELKNENSKLKSSLVTRKAGLEDQNVNERRSRSGRSRRVRENAMQRQPGESVGSFRSRRIREMDYGDDYSNDDYGRGKMGKMGKMGKKGKRGMKRRGSDNPGYESARGRRGAQTSIKEAELRKRYEVSKELGDGLFERLMEERHGRKYAEARYSACKSIALGLVERSKKDGIKNYVGSLVRENAGLSKVSDILLECKTTKAVDKRVKQLSEASATSSKKTSRPAITEDSKSRAGLGGKKRGTEKVLSESSGNAMIDGLIAMEESPRG